MATQPLTVRDPTIRCPRTCPHNAARSRPSALSAALAAIGVRAAGLLDRRLGYYSVKLVATGVAFAAGWVGFIVLGASWATLGIAVFLGVMSTQLGFLGHDAGHGQIFESRRANRRLGLGIGNGLIGLSFGWWVPKHNAHHAHPNQVNRDPDIGVSAGPRSGDDAGRHSRLSGSSGTAAGRALRAADASPQHRAVRVGRAGPAPPPGSCCRRRVRCCSPGTSTLYLTAVFWVLPLPEAVAFIAVHQAVFSFYLGCSFAPNHKGMPIIEEDAKMGFARRQIITARNVTGGRCTGFVLGGLNYQIEHHLFPTMPRPNLARARDLVRAFCLESNLGYCEVGPLRSYRQALRGYAS